MDGLAREEAPFSGRVWQEIDRTVSAVRAANCTARRFLEVDGPYGLGLTTVAGDEGWLPPNPYGADYQRWDVRRPPEREPGADPYRVPPGTYLVQGASRPVPLIASEFLLGIRAVDAYEAGCQPLDVCRATQAARDVALEEERLLYYGARNDPEALLRIVTLPGPPATENTTPVLPSLIDTLHNAVRALADRGYAGPFALAVDPLLYTDLYQPLDPMTAPVLIVELLRSLFRGGVYMVPVIRPELDTDRHRRGAVITLGRAYSRLVVGQDWLAGYRGRDGLLYRFLLMDSLQLRVCESASIQVLVGGDLQGQRRGTTGRSRRAT
jgi:uncharacterized linocin/CFP29 family protein